MALREPPRGVGSNAERTQQALESRLKHELPDFVRTGVLLEGVEFDDFKEKTVPHKLGHKPSGYMTVSEHVELHLVSSDDKTLRLVQIPETPHWRTAITAGGGAAITEAPIYEAHYPLYVHKVDIYTSTAIGASPANYVTFKTFKRAAGALGTPIQLNQWSTNSTQEGAISAWTETEVPFVANVTRENRTLASDDLLTFEMTVGGSGVPPPGVDGFMLVFDLIHPPPLKVDIWVW